MFYYFGKNSWQVFLNYRQERGGQAFECCCDEWGNYLLVDFTVLKHNLSDALFRLFELDFYQDTPSFTWEMDVDSVLAYAHKVINLHPFALLK